MSEVEDLLKKTEEELDHDTSCAYFSISELKKAVLELKEKRDQVRKREQIVRERMKIEGKIDLDFMGLEFDQERWKKTKNERCKTIDYELYLLKEKENILNEREIEIKKLEKSKKMRQSMSVKGEDGLGSAN